MTLPPRSRVSVKESVVNLLSFMRQLRLVFRMVGARANMDSVLLAPTRLGLLQSNHVRMPSPRISSKAALKRRLRNTEKLSSSKTLEERRVGKESVGTCKSRWARVH